METLPQRTEHPELPMQGAVLPKVKEPIPKKK